jgi:hypothetical protein
MARKRKQTPTVHNLSAVSLTGTGSRVGAPPLREFRELKVRLPLDIASALEEKSARTGIAMNRLVVDELRAAAEVASTRDFAALIPELRAAIEGMQDTLARYAARAQAADLADELLSSVDAVLNAQGAGALQATVERLRVVRGGLKQLERAGARHA